MTFDNDFDDNISIEIDLVNREKLLLISIYRSPNCDDLENTNLRALLTKLSNLHYSRVVFLGDFNTPQNDWTINHSVKGSGDNGYEFLEPQGIVTYTSMSLVQLEAEKLIDLRYLI